MVGNQEDKMTHYRQIFEQCDTDQNSLICLRELKAFFRSRGHREDIPRETIKYIYKLADKDGDKKLNFEEFVDLVEHPDLQYIFEHWVNSYIKFLVPQPKPVKQFVPRGRSVLSARSQKIKRSSLTGEVSIEETRLTLYATEEDEVTYLDEFTCCPPPIAMFFISLLELALFLTDEFTQKDSTLSGSGITAQIFIYEPNKRIEVWRYLTYMLVHIGYLHIVVNLAVQLLVGIPLEMVHKWWRVSLVYFSGVIAGSLATSITDPWVRLAGASGGVYSLLTAHIATIIMNWSEMTFPLVQMFIFGIIVCCDIGSSIYDRYFLNVNDQVGFAAHFGGAVAGLLVGIYILKNLNIRRGETYVWWAAVIIYVILMLSAIFVNIFMPERYPS